MSAQYEMLIPDMDGVYTKGNVTVSHSSKANAWRSRSYYAFRRDNTSFDSEPNATVKFFVDFKEPVYVERITFTGDYLTRATVTLNDSIVTHNYVGLISNNTNTLTIPKQYRANVKKIELEITGNGNYSGSPYFYIRNIQAHSPMNKVLVEMHDNLYTFSNGVASVVKPVNEATLSDYDSKGVNPSDVKGLDKIAPSFKIHVLDYKL